jgi:hypothetical protein
MLLTALAVAPLPAAATVDVVFQNGFERGFQILTPEIVVAPGEESTYCYYFLAPDNGPLGVRRWSSKMGAGMHHLILYASYDGTWAPKQVQPAGTLTQASCGLSDGGTFPGWMYAAHNPTEDLVLPADDGSGTPLAIELVAGQPMFLQMVILNPTDMPVTASALLKAEALGEGEAYVKTASYFTTNTNIAIPPNSSGTQVSGTCAVPPAVKFWWLSTRTHKYAMEAKISDIGADIVVSTDWEHPAVMTYAAPFHTFSTGPGAGLTYRCTYANSTNRTVTTGDSEETDEVCHAIGFFFPAEHPALCVNSFGPL